MAKRQTTQPYLDQDTLTQREQAKRLGVKEETVMNLGHRVKQDDLSRHPLDRVQNYDSGDTARTFRDPPRLQGVYGKCNDPKSGISAKQNIDAWAKRATANSYDGHHHKAGPGVAPTVRDDRRSVPSEARNKGSDGHLASTKDWASFEYGGDSGLGRLEKSQKY
jgi:hypothetical protein